MDCLDLIDDRLVLAKRPIPSIKPDEVLIEVYASGVNRADLAQRAGRYPPPPGASDLLGLEVAGRVVEKGSDARGVDIGEDVCALLAGGGYARFCAVPAVQVAPKPARLSFTEAASLVETTCTVWDNVWTRARLGAQEALLVHGGGSGIGVTAIQIAKALGHPTFVTVGSEAKAKACRSIGADAAINYREEDFVEAVRALTDGRGVDVILDIVGGPYLPRNLQALAEEGRSVTISISGGAVGEADLRLMMRRRLTVLASTLRARSSEQKGEVVRAVRDNIWPLIENGRLKPVIDSIYDPSDIESGHERMKASAHFGKLVIDWNA